MRVEGLGLRDLDTLLGLVYRPSTCCVYSMLEIYLWPLIFRVYSLVLGRIEYFFVAGPRGH